MSAAIRVGTRGSPLALVQTRAVIARLRDADPELGPIEEAVIRTTGDAVQDRPLAEIGGKGLFAKEIHEALFAGRIRLAVHSLKDLETELPEGIALACPMPREDARDVLLLAPGRAGYGREAFPMLPHGAVVGTASARRQAQLRHARRDLRVTVLRGNVQTRLAKLAAGACDASLLALAGLNRLGLSPDNAVALDAEQMLPASCQGIIGVTFRMDDSRLGAALARIADADATVAATAERAVLAALDGSCRTPIAAYAQRIAGGIRLTALTAREDGSFLLRRSVEGPAADAGRLGSELGTALKADSPADLFA
jgi:hydroxymethylbilane synthase